MCAERNNLNNLIQFPSPEEREGTPSDPRKLLKNLEAKRMGERVEIAEEPNVLKNVSDTEIIKNILILKTSASYMDPKSASFFRDQPPVTFGIIRAILKTPIDSLKNNRRDFATVRAYVSFLIKDFKEKISKTDLSDQAELYKYTGKLNDLFTIKGSYEIVANEEGSKLHGRAADLYKILATTEKDPLKKEAFTNEGVNEYLAQVKIYEYEKELAQKDYDRRIDYITDPKEKKVAGKNLKQTLEEYDLRIKDLNKQILKLAKIK